MAKEKIELCGKKLEIAAAYIDTVDGFPNDDAEGKRRGMLHNKFRVTVWCDIDGEKLRRSFDFYGSTADQEKHKTELNREDTLLAFRCFVDDALSGSMEFEEFCNEYGYDEDSRRAEKIHRACKQSYNKMLDLGFFESELYDVLNELSEKGVE